MRIFFAGGGTLGSVIPLVVVYEELKHHGTMIPFDVLWIGGVGGLERDAVKRAGIRFRPIITGKIRRYAHWRNIVDLFLMLVGFIQSFFLVFRFRPAVIVNAGSYIGLPVIAAGRLLGVPCVILQLDVEPVRTNLLTAPLADVICVGFSQSARYFPAKKTVVTGIPVRTVPPKAGSVVSYRTGTKPLITIIGGSTGSSALNALVLQSLDILSESAQIIHITGKQKGRENMAQAARYANYAPLEFVGDETLAMMSAADVVVSRAGAGMIAELAALKKPAILVPLPSSPQERNARIVEEQGGAIVLSQETCTPRLFAAAIVNLMNDEAKKRALSENIGHLFMHDAATRVASLIEETAKKSYGKSERKSYD